jgi:hypothetical protein
MKRIIEKQTGLFIRDDFTWNEEKEIGLDVEASQGLYQPKWDFETKTWVEGSDVIPEPIEEIKLPTLEERLQALEQLELERMFEL